VRRGSNERNRPDVEPDDAYPNTHSNAYAYSYSHSDADTDSATATAPTARIGSRPYTGTCAKPGARQHSWVIGR
jgi:hypothetical protein